MDDVELRRLGPREHPLLAMPAKVNVGGDVVGVAQMVNEADERIDHVVFAATLVVFGVPMDNVGDRFAPLVDDTIEVAVDQVRGLGANLDALGRAAPSCLAEQTGQGLLNFSKLLPYSL